MSFYLPNNALTNYITIENEISLRDLQLRQIKFILELNILFTAFKSCIITTTGITFISYSLLYLTSELAQKRGGITHSFSPYCDSYIKPVVENLENFQESSLYELLETPEITRTRAGKSLERKCLISGPHNEESVS